MHIVPPQFAIWLKMLSNNMDLRPNLSAKQPIGSATASSVVHIDGQKYP